jgi:hypothetical protein
LSERIEKDRSENLGKLSKVQSKTLELNSIVVENSMKFPEYDKEMTDLRKMVVRLTKKSEE